MRLPSLPDVLLKVTPELSYNAASETHRMTTHTTANGIVLRLSHIHGGIFCFTPKAYTPCLCTTAILMVKEANYAIT